MRWKKYTVHTTTEACDMVSMLLTDLGVEGVQIEDNVPLTDADTKGMFIDILPELPPDDGTSRLSFFLHLAEDPDNDENLTDHGTDSESPGTDEENAVLSPDGETGGSSSSFVSCTQDNSYTISDRLWSGDEIKELLQQLRVGLDEMRPFIDIGSGAIEESITEDTDWRDNWKQFFRPLKSGSFLIMPSWETVPGEYKEEVISGLLSLIIIDPGTAFGTGSHETTRLCLEAIERYVSPGKKVLDIGTGSGILAIAALKRGALLAAATELDPQCEGSIHDNAALNDITPQSLRLFIGNIIDDEDVRRDVHNAAITSDTDSNPPGSGTYDTVTANILAPVICTLASPGMADEFVKSGGIFITSGIIDDKLDDVKAAFSANPSWEIIEVESMGEWCSVTARRN